MVSWLMVNGDCMETVRMESVLFWRFYGKISLEIVWGFRGENMINQTTIQSQN